MYYIVRTNDDGTEQRLATCYGSEFTAGRRADSLNRMVRRRHALELAAKQSPGTQPWVSVTCPTCDGTGLVPQGPAACKNCGATEKPDKCSGGARCLFPVAAT